MQAFFEDVKEEWSLFIKEWLTLKCFIGGWCYFSGGWHPSSTRVLHISRDCSVEEKMTVIGFEAKRPPRTRGFKTFT